MGWFHGGFMPAYIGKTVLNCALPGTKEYLRRDPHMPWYLLGRALADLHLAEPKDPKAEGKIRKTWKGFNLPRLILQPELKRIALASNRRKSTFDSYNYCMWPADA